MEDSTEHSSVVALDGLDDHQLYQYQPLHDATRQIRLLTLLPAGKDADIHIALETVPFTKDSGMREYVALSYTWGSSDDPKHVHVVDEQGYLLVLPVTKNLHEALTYLRLQDEARVLWVDALCINQQDSSEKSQQVGIMAQIFPRAASVIAWLGLESRDSDLAVRALQRISAHLTYDSAARNIVRNPQAGPEWPTEYEKELPLEAPELSALLNLFNRPWFDRVWVWQEVLLNVDRVSLVSGNQALQWRQFANAVWCLRTIRLPQWYDSAALHKRIRFLRELCICYAEPRDIFGLLRAFENCLCADPRDKIYAMVGLQHPPHAILPIQPDYTSPVWRVYLNLIYEYCKRVKNLDFLVYVHRRTHSIPDLPSFVPDWMRELNITSIPLRYPNAGITMEAIVEDDKLRTKGAIACHISKTIPCPILQGSETGQEMQDMAFEFFDRVRDAAPDLSNLQIDGICRAVCCDSFQNVSERSPTTVEAARAAIKRLLRRDRLADSEEPQPQQWAHVISIFYVFGQSRSLCFSTEDKFGLASAEVQAGDIITVFPGCQSAMALRPLKSEEGTYEVISTAYCDGAMYGEIFLGPLPEQYTFVPDVNVTGSLKVRGFENRQTRVMELEDPRLPALPEGWEQIRMTTATDVPALYRHRDTLEEREGYWNDPRLDIEVLESRGVPFQDFILV